MNVSKNNIDKLVLDSNLIKHARCANQSPINWRTIIGSKILNGKFYILLVF